MTYYRRNPRFSQVPSPQWCMGKIFCVEFQRYPLKFHTKYLTHTWRYMHHGVIYATWLLFSNCLFRLWIPKTTKPRITCPLWRESTGYRGPKIPLILKAFHCHAYRIHGLICGLHLHWCIYPQLSNIRRSKSHTLNISRLVLQLSLCIILKPRC